jgi:REP element-mobilizing transposase RayT
MELPKRKTIRIPGYDYSTPNYYYITICTHEKKCIFGYPGDINEFGKTADECFRMIPEYNPGIKIDKYVIMPNHIHAIVIITGEDRESKRTLNFAVGQFKSAVTKRIREKTPGIEVWQRSFYDHVIRNQQGYERIWLYIEDNPRKWIEDEYYTL